MGSPGPAPLPPAYVREKTFLEASRWVRLAQQPRDSAEKSCGRKVWVTPARGLSPSRPPCPPVYPPASGQATSPIDHPPTDHPLTVSREVSVPARFRNVKTLGRLRKL